VARELNTGLDDIKFALANASGTCVVSIGPTTATSPWRVTQLANEVDGVAPAGATCVARKNGKLITPLVPDMDTAGGDPPITLRNPDVITVTWTGLTPGQRGTVTYYYDEIGWAS
jgi:hypothetical protein